MKVAAWCGFFLLGLPNILGFAIVMVPATLFLWFGPPIDQKAMIRLVEVLGGASTILVGVMVERMFYAQPSHWLPLCVTGWFAAHFIRLRKFPDFLRAAGGVVSAWSVYCILD